MVIYIYIYIYLSINFNQATGIHSQLVGRTRPKDGEIICVWLVCHQHVNKHNYCIESVALGKQ